MNVLSIFTGAHDCSGTLIKNNKVYAIEFERVSRLKYSCDQDLLTECYLKNKIGKVVVDDNQLDTALKVIKYLLSSANLSIANVEYCVGDIKLRHVKYVNTSTSHHEKHASSVFYPSKFKRSAILIIDVFGDKSPDNADLLETVSFWTGKGKSIKNLRTIYSPAYQFNEGINDKYDYHNSIGVFYMDLTIICGFKVLEAGKTMGLSPYGTDKYLKELKSFITRKGDTFKFSRKYLEFLKKEKKKRKNSFEFKADVAYVAQKILEEVVIFYCNHLYKLTKCDNLCFAGGIALNSVANGLILDRSPFKNLFILPCSNDAGESLGNALHLFYKNKKNKNVELDHNWFYLGKKYSDDEVYNLIESNESVDFVRYKNFNELCNKVSNLLANGKIIGWYQGRSELGPRALGNRSILCDPRFKKMKDVLNKKIKFREWFRPFAPAVLEEKVYDYFGWNKPSPYMLIVRNVKSKNIKAVTHIDSSARLQTVNKYQNQRFYSLLKAFYKLTNIPVLLNTSFNIKGEPIVETPTDALRTFTNSKMDYLIINNFLVSKKKSKKGTIFTRVLM